MTRPYPRRRPARALLRRRRPSSGRDPAPPVGAWTPGTGDRPKIAVDGSGLSDDAGTTRMHGDVLVRRRARPRRCCRGTRCPAPRPTTSTARRTSTSPPRRSRRSRHDQHDRSRSTLRRQPAPLPESQAGSAYYWHVRPCRAGRLRHSDPVSQHPPLPGSEVLPQGVAGGHRPVHRRDPSATEITFSWQDYFDTNLATSGAARAGNQSAKTYRIQVDNDPSFATPVDTRDGRPDDVHGLRQAVPRRHATSGGSRPCDARTTA